METLITKNAKRIKDTVRLRSKKLSNGTESLYLDIYSEGIRKYEFLKMYLLPEINLIIKEQNQATYKAAEAIRSKRVIQLNNARAGIKSLKQEKSITLLEWLDKYPSTQGNQSIENLMKLRSVKKIILSYERNGKILLKNIDKDWAKGFIHWLKHIYRKENGKHLSPGTVIFYMAKMSAILNEAIRHDLMPENPFERLHASEKIKKPDSKREYLTVEELTRLIITECKYKEVKQAYLFACYCGLRISDIKTLKGENIILNRGQYLLSVTMKKTSKPVYIPLSQNALKWIPALKKGEPVFGNLPTLPTINSIIKKWSKEASINKNITFHTSRHTFGTLMITAGADLYTTSKLMGHSDVRTTQIYAKIIDSKKIEAVNLIDRLFETL